MGKFARSIARLFGYDLMRFSKSFRFEATLDRLIDNHRFDGVVDIGANQGWFTRHCLNAIADVPAWAFEPASGLAMALEAFGRSEPRLTVSRFALGDTAGDAVLNLAAGSGVYNSLNAARPEFEGALRSFDFIGQEQVQVTTLDHFAKSSDIGKCTDLLIKIDTQGHDFKVLMGGGSTLRKAAAVIVELPFQTIYETEESHRDILDYMDQAGFDIYSIAPISTGDDGRLLEADAFFTRR